MDLRADAYCKVFGVTEAELSDKQHQTVLNNVLLDIAYSSKLYEKETERGMASRLAMDGPANGEVADIALYFKELYPELKSKTSWEVLFEIYKRMNGKSESLDLSDRNYDLGGTTDMSSVAMDELLKMEQETLGADVKGGSAPSAETNTVAVSAVKDELSKQKADRMNLSKKAVVKSIVIAKPMAKDILADEKPVGKIASVDKAKEYFGKFCEKVGAHESNGEVTFDNINASQTLEAMAMYNALKEATVNADKEFDVYVSTSTGTIKGYSFAENDAEKGNYITSQQMLDTLMTRSAGGFYFPDKAYQVRYQKATRKPQAGKKGKGTSSNKNAYSGIVTVAIANRKGAMDKFQEYYKKTTDEVAETTGFKSNMSVKYIREKQDGDNAVKYGTFRIPLVTRAKKLVVASDELAAAFPESAGGLRQIEPVDINKFEDILGDFSQILAQAAAVTQDMTGDLAKYKATVTSAQKAEAAAQQEEIGGNL